MRFLPLIPLLWSQLLLPSLDWILIEEISRISLTWWPRAAVTEIPGSYSREGEVFIAWSPAHRFPAYRVSLWEAPWSTFCGCLWHQASLVYLRASLQWGSHKRRPPSWEVSLGLGTYSKGSMTIQTLHKAPLAKCLPRPSLSSGSPQAMNLHLPIKNGQKACMAMAGLECGQSGDGVTNKATPQLKGTDIQGVERT